MKSAGKVLAALWVFQLANYLDRVAISFAGPHLMKTLGISPASFGVILSSFGLGYFLAQIPGGILSDRKGAKLLLVAGPVLWAVFTGITALAATAVGFVLARFCFGLSEGISNAAYAKVIGDNFPARQRARAMAIGATAITIAPTVAAPLIGLFLLRFNWPWLFVVMIAPALLSAVINWKVIPSDRPSIVQGVRPSAGEWASLLRIARERPFQLIASAYFAFSIAYWGFVGWMPSYLALGRHIEIKALGLLGGLPYAFGFGGLLAVGWMDEKFLHARRSLLVVATYLLGGLSLFLAYQATTTAVAMIGLCGSAFALYGSLAPFSAIMLDRAPDRHRATYVGGVHAAGQLGGMIAPAVIGYSVSRTGTFAGGFGLMVAGFCVAGAAMLALARSLRSAGSTPAGEAGC